MSFLCYSQPRCMARLRSDASQQWRLYSGMVFRYQLGVLLFSQSFLHIKSAFPVVQIVSTFSTTSRFQLPRNKAPNYPRASDYLGFRNESVENRYVREHNLFNPSLSYSETKNGNKLENASKSSTTSSIADMGVVDLEREMIWLANNLPSSKRLFNLLGNLTITKRVRPNILHYEALILANTSPEYGSAENVKMLLEEMEEHKILASATTYTAVLRAMTVHPDPDILAEVIESCSKMWIEIDLEMLHLISVAYLRAGTMELALEYLEQVEVMANNSDSKIELWLYVIFIHELALAKDWDAVMRMCYRLNDDRSLGVPLAMRQVDVPYEFWHWLLEQAAAADEVWVAAWIWKLWVHKQWIQPQRKLCIRVLEIAADAGLVEIADSVFGYLKFMIPVHEAQGTNSQTDEQQKKERQHVRYLVKQAHHNTGMRRQRTSVPRWRLLREELNTPSDLDGSKSFDPWAFLDETTDPGRAWPRILRERSEEEEIRIRMIEMRNTARTDQNESMAEQFVLAPSHISDGVHVKSVNATPTLQSETVNTKETEDRSKQTGSAEKIIEDEHSYQPFR